MLVNQPHSFSTVKVSNHFELIYQLLINHDCLFYIFKDMEQVTILTLLKWNSIYIYIYIYMKKSGLNLYFKWKSERMNHLRFIWILLFLILGLWTRSLLLLLLFYLYFWWGDTSDCKIICVISLTWLMALATITIDLVILTNFTSHTVLYEIHIYFI